MTSKIQTDVLKNVNSSVDNLTLGTSGQVTVGGSLNIGGNYNITGSLTLGSALSVANGGTGTGTAFTAGSVVFAGTSGVYSQDNSQLFWDDTNNRLGIGTPTPAFKVEIASGYNNGLHLKDTTGSVYGGYFVEAATMALVTRSNHGLRFGTNDQTRMTLDASGNLGIGTTTPDYKLHVRGDNASATTYFTVGNYTASGAYGSGMIFIAGSGASDYGIVNYGNSGTFNFQSANTSGAITFSVGVSERMRIDASGNLLVGLPSNYTAKTEILSASAASSTSNVLGLYNNTVGSVVGSALRLGYPSVGYGTRIVNYQNAGATYAGSLAFEYGNGSGYTESMRINSSGNVGIGTTTPGFKLDLYDATTAYFRMYGETNVVQQVMRYSTDTSAAQLQLYKARGTSSAPTAVISGDITARLNFFGYDGTSNLQTAEIRSNVDAAPGTGSMPGRLSFYTTANGASSVTERMRIDSSGNVVINTAAIATTATDGFLYVPTCAGTPTGTPTTYTGRAPIVVNTTNNKLYFYSGGAWRDAGP